VISHVLSAPVISHEITQGIKRMSPLTGGEWDRNTKEVRGFKKEIREQLKGLQNMKCAYCAEELDVSSRIEIEHIAPKGGVVRPMHYEFAFTLKNLVLACNKCNADLKNTFDPIINKCGVYRECTFSIVHPYFDEPNHCYHWNGPIISPKNLKGTTSIRIFELDSEIRTISRAKKIIVNRALAGNTEFIDLIGIITTYKKAE
jgi:uncharacterized protein (TIGR02646 family)